MHDLWEKIQKTINANGESNDVIVKEYFDFFLTFYTL